MRFDVVGVHEQVRYFGIGLREFVESCSNTGVSLSHRPDFGLGLLYQSLVLGHQRLDGIGISFLNHLLRGALEPDSEVHQLE